MDHQLFKTVDAETLHMRAAACSVRGRVRRSNEDSVLELIEDTLGGDTVGLYIVCDGMGGREAGDVASQLAVETIVTVVEENLLYGASTATATTPLPGSTADITALLANAIVQANGEIQNFINGSSISKMGTTANAMIVLANQAHIASVGDSRTYLWRDGQVKQLTSDHTLTNELVQQNIISLEEAHDHQFRHILTRAVGTAEVLDVAAVDTYRQTLEPGDRILLCSDGLWHAFPGRDDLAAHIAQANSPETLCRQLVDEANRRDGSDNISAVAVFLAE